MSVSANMEQDVLRTLLSEEQLKQRVAELGRQLTEEYRGKDLLLVTVLKGAVVFLADLMRCIDVPAEIDFMVVSSYGAGVKLENRGPASIRIVTLLDKPARRKADLKADYVGFEVPDDFVIGYGLDYDEKYRNLPYIGVLKPEVYSE